MLKKNKILLCALLSFFTYLSAVAANAGSAEKTGRQSVTLLPATAKEIVSMGRTEKNSDGSLRFSYPGVSFWINMEGKSLVMDAQSTSDQSYLEVIVDNGEPKVIKLSSTPKSIALVSDAVVKKHSVEIIHRSETWHGIVTLKQFSTDGKFLAATHLPKRKILVLGDSVTCGEAIERVEGEQKNTHWWNPRLSYGMLSAKALNAQVQLVCMGGHGLIRTWDGKTNELNLPDYYDLTIPDQAAPIKWDQHNYEPDLIVSAIGTNDFSKDIPDREVYVKAYVQFVSKLLSEHKRAVIVLTEGAILNGEKKSALVEYLKETVKRVSDKRVQYVASTYYPGDKIDAHPTKEQHAATANDLVPPLKAIMNW